MIEKDSMLPTIVDARSNFIYFTADLNSDMDLLTDPGEHVSFCLFNSDIYGLSLSYNVGTNDNIGYLAPTDTDGPVPVVHTHPTYRHDVVIPVEALEFYYTLSDGSKTIDPDIGRMKDIRSVEVTILSRAFKQDPRYLDTQVYIPASGIPFNGGNPFNDNTRRRMLTANIGFRNMGLN